MKKQIIITSAMLTSLVLFLTCSAWAEPERRRGREGGQHLRDDGGRRPDLIVKPDRGRQWQGRKGHRDPSGHWKPKGRHHVRKHDDRRWHRRKPHSTPRHRWQQHRRDHRSPRWRPGRHHRPHFYRRPAHSRYYGRHP